MWTRKSLIPLINLWLQLAGNWLGIAEGGWTYLKQKTKHLVVPHCGDTVSFLWAETEIQLLEAIKLSYNCSFRQGFWVEKHLKAELSEINYFNKFFQTLSVIWCVCNRWVGVLFTTFITSFCFITSFLFYNNNFYNKLFIKRVYTFTWRYVQVFAVSIPQSETLILLMSRSKC